MLTNSEFLLFSIRSTAHFCPSCPVSFTLGVSGLRFPQGSFFFIFVTIIIIFNWRIIALKCIGFYHATMWITHNYIKLYIYNYVYIHIYISPPSWVSLPPPPLTFYFILECSWLNTIVLISDIQQSDSIIHIHASVLFQILFPIRLLQNIEQSSLCYAVGPCWLPVLTITVQFQWIKMCSTPLHHVSYVGQN